MNIKCRFSSSCNLCQQLKSEHQNSKKTTLLPFLLQGCKSTKMNEISWSYEGRPLRIGILSAFAKWRVVTHTVSTNALCYSL